MKGVCKIRSFTEKKSSNNKVVKNREICIESKEVIDIGKEENSYYMSACNSKHSKSKKKMIIRHETWWREKKWIKYSILE